MAETGFKTWVDGEPVNDAFPIEALGVAFWIEGEPYTLGSNLLPDREVSVFEALSLVEFVSLDLAQDLFIFVEEQQFHIAVVPA